MPMATMTDDQPPPTPDELLLELMDLVQLAFPAGLDRMVVTFVENEDKKRPALSNLDARGPVDAPRRPALGHDDNRVLDAINGLLADLADATERDAGLRVHAGSITVETGADRERVVRLSDARGEVMSRRFDESELRWLLFTPRLFAALNETEARERELVERTARALDGTRRFDIDMVKGTIRFTGPGAEQVFSFELLASWAEETGRILWGWANDQTPPALTRRVDALRQRSTDAGLRALNEGVFACPQACAERLARHAAVTIGATGIYMAPFAGRSPSSPSGRTKGVMMLALFGG